MADIFISYKREDRKLASLLANKLTATGFSVWWDHDLLGGVEYSVEIENQLLDAACVIVIWSARSVKSSYVKDEARKALNRGVLVPVSFDETEPPLGFGMTHVVAFGNSKHLDEDTFDILCQSIEKKTKSTLQRNPIQPPAPRPSKKTWLWLLVFITLIAFFIVYKSANNTPPHFSNIDISNIHPDTARPASSTDGTTQPPEQNVVKKETDLETVMDYFNGRGGLQAPFEGDSVLYYRIKEITATSIKMDVDYNFNSSHGQVYLGGWLWPGGDNGVSSGYPVTSLTPGKGTAEITISITPPKETKTSTSILLFMLESYKNPFAIHLFPYTHTWKPN